MDQKRILWIVAAVGIFLLVVVGAALILYSPQKPHKNLITASSDKTNLNNTYPSDVSSDNKIQNNIGSEIPTTVRELTVIAENATIISDKASNSTYPSTQNSLASPGEIVSSLKLSNAQIVQNDKPDATTQNTLQQNALPQSALPENTFATSPNGTTQFPQVPSAQNSTTQLQIEVKPIKIETVAAETSPKEKVEQKPKAPAKQVTNKVTSTPPAKKTVPVTKQAKAEPTAPKVKDSYWVQAASYTNKQNAEEARSALNEEKIPSELFTYTDAKGKIFYRVRVGPYTTKSEAEYWKTRIAEVDKFSKSTTYITNSSLPLAKK